MRTPMIAGRTAALVPPGARLTPDATRGVTIPSRRDPTHYIAWAEVAEQRSDYAEVTYPNSTGLAFRAWRVSRVSWAWQTASMGVPAFMPYASAPSPRPLGKGTVYGMDRAEWDAYGRPAPAIPETEQRALYGDR